MSVCQGLDGKLLSLQNLCVSFFDFMCCYIHNDPSFAVFVKGFRILLYEFSAVLLYVCFCCVCALFLMPVYLSNPIGMLTLFTILGTHLRAERLLQNNHILYKSLSQMCTCGTY